eukprot:GDKI01026629.1.p1 GENE.GDKI01026629.1~~GDKI01026629.1.p1  ORF type:complete len:207 (+),score=45.99 GDKI01026629.1:247-867(+)
MNVSNSEINRVGYAEYLQSLVTHPSFSMHLNTHQLWLLETNASHPVHMHVNHFRLLSGFESTNRHLDMQNFFAAGDWQDTILMRDHLVLVDFVSHPPCCTPPNFPPQQPQQQQQSLLRRSNNAVSPSPIATPPQTSVCTPFNGWTVEGSPNWPSPGDEPQRIHWRLSEDCCATVVVHCHIQDHEDMGSQAAGFMGRLPVRMGECVQ